MAEAKQKQKKQKFLRFFKLRKIIGAPGALAAVVASALIFYPASGRILALENAPSDTLTAASGARATIFLSPQVSIINEGSTFDVAVYLNTRGASVDEISVEIRFAPDKLTVVRPSRGKSFISVWSKSPTFSNSEGTLSFSGTIPNGVRVENGLITAITFQAKATGRAEVKIAPASQAFAREGEERIKLDLDLGSGVYTVISKPPEGIPVESITHPFDSEWYNSGSPVFTWEKEAGADDFSFILDNKPFTNPDSIADTPDAIAGYENLPDGIWFFHLKARKGEIWGPTAHFRIRIDTAPPRSFVPKIGIIPGEGGDKGVVTFFTTDSLSGVDHFEIGVLDKSQSPLLSPVFVEAESPYQIPDYLPGTLRVVVRAFDRAGNVRDEIIEPAGEYATLAFLRKHVVVIYFSSIALFLALGILHYFFGHHLITLPGRAAGLIGRRRRQSAVRRW